MPTLPVQLKRNGTPGASGPSSLLEGELAINYADGKIYWKNASNVITSFTFQSYALASHTHAASDITSGTLDIARIPTGSTSSAVCIGNDARLSDTRTPTDGSVTTAKIANDAVTYAKIQNVSSTDRLLGRSSAGAGDVEEITCTSFGRSLIDDADAAAARTTLSVQPTASPTFTGTATFSGQVLVTAGSVSACSVAPSGDLDTGIIFPAANQMALVQDGAQRLIIGLDNVKRTFVRGNSEQSALGVNYGSTGGFVYFGATSSSNAPDAAITSAGGSTLMTFANDGKISASGVYSATVGGTNRDVFVDSGGLIGYVSSIRESKTDIVTLDDVSWLSALSPVSYRYRKRNADGTYSNEADGVTDYGLIAEDVEAVRPELCFYDDVDGEPQLRGVTYSKLITPMLRYIQQLEARIAALEERLNHA